MKQQSLFDQQAPCKKPTHYWKLYVDGASKKNPGPAGAGFCIYKDDTLIQSHGFYLGNRTNNQAEYLALLLGLFYLQRSVGSDDLVLVLTDSQLMARQLQGIYKVKNTTLQPYYKIARIWLNNLKGSIEHVLREENTQADAMANKGVKERQKMPSCFIQALAAYNIDL